MGVHGLWRLIEPSGKPVPLETLENKILAVDISIWLHQAIKGFQDSKGAPLPNAHLLGIFHRVCKLLYFRIKPVFIFDGGVPVIKKQTIVKRQEQKSKNLRDASDIQSKLLKVLLKHSAINKVITDKTTTSKKRSDDDDTKDNMFMLPEPPVKDLDSTLNDDNNSNDESSSTTSSPMKQWDLHTIDEKSEHFRSLPAEVRHEILTEIMETRKQSSWGKIHEMPSESNDFSNFQMRRLLKRFSVQSSLEDAVKEMGGHSLSLGELEKLLNAEGIITDSQSNVGSRIASNEDTRYLLIKDVQKAMEDLKKEEKQKLENETKLETENDNQNIEELMKNPLPTINENVEEEFKALEKGKDDEYENDLAAAIQLSLQDQPSTSKTTSVNEKSFIENFKDGDFESDSDNEVHVETITKLQQAKSYMMEYSGLTPNEIDKIINTNKQKHKINKKSTMSKIVVDTLKSVTKEEEGSSKLKNTSEVDNNINLPMVKIIDNKSIEIISDSDGSESEDMISVKKNALNKDSITEEINLTNQQLKIDNKIDSETGENNDENNSVDIMSDSDDSEFVEVNTSTSDTNLKNKNNKPSLQIVFNPNEKIEDDLFSDIFNKSPNSTEKSLKPVNENLSLQIVTNPNEKIEDDMCKNIFDKNSNTENAPETKSLENTTATPIDIANKRNENIIIVEEVVKNVNKNETQDSELMSKNQANKTSENSDDVVKTPLINTESDKPLLTMDELNKMKADLMNEKQELIMERNTKKRVAENITDQMYQEAQELLELFGVPYVVAPMEAEAQCAFLNEINLTDGTITDDSDIWLFGGQIVYKNFFNNNKNVLEFRSDSIKHHFKLTREQLILLALLVGSDYTLGIQGIGPVTALEILAAFPPDRQTNINILTQDQLISGLKEFRTWFNEGKSVGVRKTTLRSKLKNVNILEGFPSAQVVNAYLQPEVETCADKFTWAQPDIVGLIDFAKEKFGWTKVKSEEILKPVIKRMQDKNLQKTIRDYFATKHKISVDLIEEQMSKRVKTAIRRMGSKPDDLDETELTKPPKERKRTKKDGESTKTKRMKNKNVDEALTSTSTNSLSADDKKTATDFIPTKRNRKTQKEQLHAKEFIPQREKDKLDALKSKLKAIEVFRKSKEGPGFVQKRAKVIRPPKEDAELSESSSDD